VEVFGRPRAQVARIIGVGRGEIAGGDEERRRGGESQFCESDGR